MLNKLRLWSIKKLLKDNDGYTYTGFSEKDPIKFYYDETNNRFLVGMRSEAMYYAEPSLSGWCLTMSRHLDWESLNMKEPYEVDFKDWLYGIMDTVHKRYMEVRNSK